LAASNIPRSSTHPAKSYSPHARATDFSSPSSIGGWTVPRCGLYSRNAYDWTARLAAIAAAAELIKATSFTIDGKAVVLGPDGLSRFEELSRRRAARTAILYTFDLIEHDGEDLRNLPFLDRKAGAGATAARYSFRDAGRKGDCFAAALMADLVA
jgi:hypothetical protein